MPGPCSNKNLPLHNNDVVSTLARSRYTQNMKKPYKCNKKPMKNSYEYTFIRHLLWFFLGGFGYFILFYFFKLVYFVQRRYC